MGVSRSWSNGFSLALEVDGASEFANELEDDAITLSSSGSILSRKSSKIDLSSSVRPLGVTSSLDIFSSSLARDSESTAFTFSRSFSGGFSGSGGEGGGEGDQSMGIKFLVSLM